MGGMNERPDVKMEVVYVPMLDTGLGQMAGYANDVELVEAWKKERAELEALLTPETLAKLDAAEREVDRRLLGF